MMKLAIKKEFRDKITGELYKVDDVKEFTDDRAKEILADPRGLVEAAPAEPEEPKQKKPATKKPATKKAKK